MDRIRHYIGWLLCIATGVAYMAYIWVRSKSVPITVDEGYTIMTYVPKSVRSILLYDYNEISANNHILNTLWIKGLEVSGDLSVRGVRSLNIIGGLMYVLAGWGLARHFFRGIWAPWCAWVLWLAHPVLVEYFGVARGYGISYGLMALSLWAAVKWFDGAKKGFFTGSIIAAWLAVSANFSALAYFLFLMAVFAWHIARTRERLGARLLTLVLSTISLAALMYQPVRQMRKEGTFDLFGREGFYKDFALSFSRQFFHAETHWGEDTFRDGAIIMGIVVLSGFIFWTLKCRFAPKTPTKKNGWTALQFALVACPAVLGVQVAITLMADLSWLTGRTTLLFWPVFAITLMGLLHILVERWYWLGSGVMTILAALWLLNFRYSANTTDVMEWDFDRDTYRTLDYLKALHVREGRQKPLRFGCFWMYNPSFTFHLKHGPDDWGRYIVPNNPPWVPLPQPQDSVEFFFASKDQKRDLDSLYTVIWEAQPGERMLFRRRK
jgi:hypothetical protein